MSENDTPELAEERNFISGIYNYCDRWCEKCPFTLRCQVYATDAVDEDLADPEVLDINNQRFWHKLESIFRETHEMIADWAEDAGVDLESIITDAVIAGHEESEKEATEHQFSLLARHYAETVREWFQEEFATAPEVHYSVDSEFAEDIGLTAAAGVIQWYQFFIAAKVMRALMVRTGEDSSSGEETKGEDHFVRGLGEDNVDDGAARGIAFEDCNGSAKIALIAIDRSIAAWHAMEVSLPKKSDSIAPIVAELERLRWLMEQAFPDARGFIRPGFDEESTDLIN